MSSRDVLTRVLPTGGQATSDSRVRNKNVVRHLLMHVLFCLNYDVIIILHVDRMDVGRLLFRRYARGFFVHQNAIGFAQYSGVENVYERKARRAFELRTRNISVYRLRVEG